MTFAELCAGYGGLFLAMQHAGWPVELAWYAETDPDAARLLSAHHPGVPNAGDITTAQFTAMEPVDVLACGYPCQPFSVAGKRKGTDDHRWIWPDVARAVRLVRPRFVLLENVPGHLAWGFPECSGTWPRSGTWDRGHAYAHPMSVPRTDASGCSSLLPTPTATPYGRNLSGSEHAIVRPSLETIARELAG